MICKSAYHNKQAYNILKNPILNVGKVACAVKPAVTYGRFVVFSRYSGFLQ
jgi:hypothetical protein